jgi:hypothetical protein
VQSDDASEPFGAAADPVAVTKSAPLAAEAAPENKANPLCALDAYLLACCRHWHLPRALHTSIDDCMLLLRDERYHIIQ